jgi:hypothetical protein
MRDASVGITTSATPTSEGAGNPIAEGVVLRKDEEATVQDDP